MSSTNPPDPTPQRPSLTTHAVRDQAGPWISDLEWTKLRTKIEAIRIPSVWWNTIGSALVGAGIPEIIAVSTVKVGDTVLGEPAMFMHIIFAMVLLGGGGSLIAYGRGKAVDITVKRDSAIEIMEAVESRISIPLPVSVADDRPKVAMEVEYPHSSGWAADVIVNADPNVATSILDQLTRQGVVLRATLLRAGSARFLMNIVFNKPVSASRVKSMFKRLGVESIEVRFQDLPAK